MTGERKPKFFYGYVMVLAGCFIQVVGFGIYSSYGVFFSPLVTEFGWSRAVVSGAASLFLVMWGLFSMIVGGLNDRFGPRITVTVCGLFWGLGYLLMTQLSAAWQLYLFYGVIAGMGLSFSDVLPLSTVARWFVRRRGMMSGIVKVGAGVGMLILPPLANWLISNYGWRTSFLVLGIVALVFTILVAQFLKRDPGQMGLMPYGANKAESESLRLKAAGFSFREAIRTRQFWVFCIIYLFVIFCCDAILVHIVPHAVDLEIPPAIAATVLAAIGGVSIVGRFIMGSIGDRVGNRLAMIICFTMLVVTFFWLQFASELWMLYTFAVIYGFGHGGLYTLMSPWLAELFGLSAHGAIFGAVSFVGTIGGAIGPFLFGYIFDMTGSYQLAFLVGAALSVIAIVFTFFIRPISNARRENDSIINT